ncbi:YceD family protein [Haloimpatiens lingqiaonensis]|uniref:YceD family protein n=1 Tax=Haloimpatiens lingqiaonensis TaxID=1380675 RepID=UPI0010FE26C3|nr:DUF177 domain-containing protein [Haloimpatiens lingqiaonensis]
MIINVLELIKNKVSNEELSFTLDLSNFHDGNEAIEITKTISFTGVIKNSEEDLILKGHVEGEVILTCSRCLDKFNYKLDLDIEEIISTNPEDKDENIIFIDNNKLNIDDIIVNNIIMSLPVKRLCRENCKGLCQLCGTNLNYSNCNCKDEDTDPRLAKLKDFFSDN